MNWYITKIVFRIVFGTETTAQFDEQLRLVEAANEQEAFTKAMNIGQKEEHIFINKNQIAVHWKFITVALVSKINTLTDGVEIYSTINEQEEPENYMHFINKKATSYANFQEQLLAAF